ncbi:MAG: dTDP-4-dehydrorhamnose 3,5-epimerase [Granulosicoccus sp.]
MDFQSTNILGAYLVHLNKLEDERGFFARVFCVDEFKQAGINSDVVQANLSQNIHKGTVRGMHYQIAPALETKLVRCIKGSIQDTIVDMRPDSATYRQHVSVTLSADNGHALFVPTMCAHGFQTLEDNTDVLYMVSGAYTPACERGLRHDDPALNINWPLPANHISEKDASWSLLENVNT